MIKVNFVNGYVEDKKAKKKEAIKKENDEYDFIFDSGLNVADKVARFIEITYNEKIPTDNINKYLNDDVNEIISGLY